MKAILCEQFVMCELAKLWIEHRKSFTFHIRIISTRRIWSNDINIDDDDDAFFFVFERRNENENVLTKVKKTTRGALVKMYFKLKWWTRNLFLKIGFERLTEIEFWAAKMKKKKKILTCSLIYSLNWRHRKSINHEPTDPQYIFET